MNCAANDYLASVKTTHSILEQNTSYSFEPIADQLRAKTELALLKKLSEDAEKLKLILPSSLQRAMDLIQEMWVSSFLSSLPIKEFGFSLCNGAFRYELALRYNVTGN